MDILWLLIPAPFVGYLVAQWIRMAVSDDPKAVRRLLEDQPVTMVAALTILGSAAIWILSVLAQRLLLS